MVTVWRPWSASGSGYFGGPQQRHANAAVLHAVAVPTVVEHGDAERRLAEIDVAMGAHLELGRIPRVAGVRRSLDVTELDVAGRLTGVHVERHHQ